MNKLPELLAPAGSLESLKAAVYAGADAVYFGVPQFNARMKAKNFTASELDEAFSLCALHGVRTHITLNTLLFGRERFFVFGGFYVWRRQRKMGSK